MPERNSPKSVAALSKASNVVRLGFFCLWLAAALRCAGLGSGDYLVKVWSSDDGLLSSSVTAVAQTPDGYLWVGTYNGLARFDGNRFVNFGPDLTPELQRARIRRLYLDGEGKLWINTYDGSLTTYRNGEFSLEWLGSGSSDATVTMVSSRSNRPVFLLHTGELIRRQAAAVGTNGWEMLRAPAAASGVMCAEDSQGSIWYRGRDQKVWRLQGDQFTPVFTSPGLQSTNINTLAADSRGNIWVGTDREVARWTGGRFEDMTPTNGEAPLNVLHLQPTGSNEMWVVANGQVRKATGRHWDFEAEVCRGVFDSFRERIGIREDGAGGVWIHDYGKGLFHIRSDGRGRQMTAEEGFPGDRVDCWYEDREGNVWAGVDRGGLVRLREKRFMVLAPGDSPVAKAVVTVTEDAQGGVWVGTFGGGLHRWFNEEWQNLPVPGGTRTGYIFSLYPTSNDRLWASAGDEDLYLYQRGAFQLVRPLVHGLKALLEAKDGRLWLGTKSGLAYLANGQMRRLLPEDGVQRHDVRALAETGRGVIWAGAGDGTLYRLETNRVDFFRPTDQLAAQPIWALLAGDDGTVWAGTFRGGLLRLREGKFTRYLSQHGLPDDVITQILDDGLGWLWLGSQSGIFRIEKRELDEFATGQLRTVNCTAYGRYDGLPSLECSGSYQPAAWRTRDGRLLFATLKGVVSVNPAELTLNRLPPPVAIEDILLDGRVASPSRPVLGSIQHGSLSPPSIEVPPGKRQIELRYTALSFVSPDRVRFRYQLDGVDADWVEAGTRRSAQYSFLRPGDYRFQVKACNNDGVWNREGVTLRVKVLPHFYQTWWFIGVLGFAIVAGVAVVVRQSAVREMRRELEQMERQRAIERDRARIAKDIHDDLGAGLTHITLLTELARRSPNEETPAHLNHISDMARELTRAMDETVWAVNPRNDSLEGLMTYVTKFAQDYLNVAGIRCRLDLPVQLAPHALPAEARHNLYLAVKETLHNVVKHARASEVWLRFRETSDAFTISIEDNGCGLAGDKQLANGGRLSSGHGLDNLEKRLAACGGQCKVSSDLGKGTLVELCVAFAALR